MRRSRNLPAPCCIDERVARGAQLWRKPAVRTYDPVSASSLSGSRWPTVSEGPIVVLRHSTSKSAIKTIAPSHWHRVPTDRWRPRLRDGEEKRWLAAARARLGAVRAESHGDLLNRALRLPELEGLKGERGRPIQGAIADEGERLQAGIAYAGGARSPLLDVLFHNLKVP